MWVWSARLPPDQRNAPANSDQGLKLRTNTLCNVRLRPASAMASYCLPESGRLPYRSAGRDPIIHLSLIVQLVKWYGRYPLIFWEAVSAERRLQNTDDGSWGSDVEPQLYTASPRLESHEVLNRSAGIRIEWYRIFYCPCFENKVSTSFCQVFVYDTFQLRSITNLSNIGTKKESEWIVHQTFQHHRAQEQFYPLMLMAVIV